MKSIYLLIAMIVIGALSYFYISPALVHYKEQVDAQAYQRTNLLEGIDTQPINARGY